MTMFKGGGVSTSLTSSSKQHLLLFVLLSISISLVFSTTTTTTFTRETKVHLHNAINQQKYHYSYAGHHLERDIRLYIIQFKDSVTKEQHKQFVDLLDQFNAYIHHYIPNHSYLVVFPENHADSNTIGIIRKKIGFERLEDVHELTSTLKISPTLGQQSLDYSLPTGIRVSLVDSKSAALLRVSLLEEFKSSNNIQLIDNTQQQDTKNPTVELMFIGGSSKNLNFIKNVISWTSRQCHVYWVERSSYAMQKVSNKYAKYSVQNGALNETATPMWTSGLTGIGEIVGCADSGLDLKHCFFFDAAGNTPSTTHRKVVSYDALADSTDVVDGHGTHVVGTILGSPSDPNAPLAEFMGGAPDARVAFIDIGGANRGVLNGIPSDPAELFRSTYANGARIHLDAWNSQDSGAYYTTITAQLDAFQSENLDFLAVRSAGNSPLFQFQGSYSVTQESVSKNSLVVGSYNQNPVHAMLQADYAANTTYTEYTLSTFSGVGPTSDGRIKPDLFAPGSPIVSSRSQGAAATDDHCSAAVIGGAPTPSLVAMEGTSQSAAVAASAAVLTRQYLRLGFYQDGATANATAAIANPSGSLVKAMMINTANTNHASTVPFSTGFGSVDLSSLIKTSGSTEKIDVANMTDAVANTESMDQVCFQVSGGDIYVTLVWTDPAGSPLSPVALVNDLDLVVYQYIDSNLTLYSLEDHINNVEHLVIRNAQPGRYDIRVYGSNVPVPDQTFSVVTRGNIERIYCSQCYYDPNEYQEQECYVENGIGIQSCHSDNLWGTCEIYSCDSGYVLDKGITKKCVTMLALTLYNIVLLAAFGIIILAGVVAVLLFYKSRSLNDEKYKSKHTSNGNGNSNSNNGGAAGGGKPGDNNNNNTGRGGKAVELTVVGAGADYDNSKKDNNNNNGSGSGSGGGTGIGAGAGGRDDDDDQEPLIEQEKVEYSIIEIISLARPEAKLIILGIILSFVDIALGLAIPLVSANIFDLLYSGQSSEINSVILTFALIIIGMLIVQFLYGILLALAGHKIIARLRKEMFRALLIQDMDFFNERKTGELMSRLASDVSSVRNIISDSIPHMITQIATILGGLIMLFIISWKLTLVVLCPLPILMVFSHFYGNYIEEISMKVQDALADAATHAAETLFNIRTVRWFSAEEREVSRFAVLINKSYQIALRMTIWNGIYNSTSGIFEQLSIFILLWYGTSLVRARDLTPSMLIAFNLFLPFISGALTQISTLYTTYKSYKGSSYRFFEIMQRVPSIPPTGGIRRDRVTGNLAFKNVAFSYAGARDNKVLSSVNLQFQPGTITALIGPSGGGKTTMLSLIGRLYDIEGGQITLDGTDIREWDLVNLHDHISIVNQEPSLFSGTIAENVSYGRPDATRQQVMEACRLANAHDFITAMPNGYDTVIGERGTALSGGQKQRIAIARTIIKNPTVLLLDEATSELDVESERLVQEAIDNLVQNRTVIIVAHRLSTILTADIIAVISEGTVTEMGAPEQLVEQKGMFYDFVQIQYGKHNGDIPIHIPTKNRNQQDKDKLRLRSETILQRVGQGAPVKTKKAVNLLDDDPSGSVIMQPAADDSEAPMWHQAKKHTKRWNENKTSHLIRGSAAIESQWRRGAVDDKLNRLVAKTRKKGFFNNNDKGQDIKQSLVNY
ncbi:ABC transporter B family protein [Cavenderia fasciculata]|uniref:ABC transporter B family protein n=1 Tax=Cavenderia fasciculata TaxID=261658 RepID=F4Q8N1_CACFS|nr:ABC transporter B family protein [Cavenderia fasciculata]EGG15050.1 ABC transporter B family protein [Cavenderia fasciculata]|eukprot:XP_004351770.1 ABC transporter B family protein [Cavenderia fasciculata]